MPGETRAVAFGRGFLSKMVSITSDYESSDSPSDYGDHSTAAGKRADDSVRWKASEARRRRKTLAIPVGFEIRVRIMIIVKNSNDTNK